MAKVFINIYDAYDLGHVLAAKRAVSKAGKQPHKKTFAGSWKQKQLDERAERVRLNRKALSRDSTRLLDHVAAGIEAENKFGLAISMANCGNFLGRVKMLSETLAALHDARKFLWPDKVSEGRLAFASICRDRDLLRQVGIIEG